MGLKSDYQNNIAPELKEEGSYPNEFMVPKVEKIVVNVGLGEALTNKKALQVMEKQLALITGQKPIITRARRAISTFKLRAGMPIGLKVTLRGKRMYDFLEKLIKIVLPRIRDFRGIDPKSFDSQGNISIGFSEIIAFPEVRYEDLDKIRGLEVIIVTTAKTDKEAKMLLKKMGMPFQKKT